MKTHKIPRCVRYYLILMGVFLGALVEIAFDILTPTLEGGAKWLGTAILLAVIYILWITYAYKNRETIDFWLPEENKRKA